MLHTKTKRLEISSNINVEISEVDHYTWIFTSRIFRLALEITFFLNKYFSLQMAYELLSQTHKVENLINGERKRRVPIRGRGLEMSLKKISGRGAGLLGTRE